MLKIAEILRPVRGKVRIRPRFKGRTIDPRGGIIAPDGRIVSLRPQSRQVLDLLSQRVGEIVTKDEIVDAVWSKAAVSDDSITQCVADIRRALGDSDRTTLETIPRKGFRLNTDVKLGQASNAKPMRAVVALAAATVSLVIGIAAVLSWGVTTSQDSEPRITLISDSGAAWLANDVRAALTRYASVQLVADPAARFRLDLSSDRFERISAMLVDTATNQILFSETFEVRETDRREKTYAKRLAAAAASPFGGHIARVLFENARRSPVAELSRPECFIHAFQVQGGWNDDETARRAETCLRALITTDPQDARALALLGALYAQQYWWGVGLPEPAKSDQNLRLHLPGDALAFAGKADALNGARDSAIYFALARAYYANCAVDRLRSAADRALEINPDDPNILGSLGNWIAYTGDWKRGPELAKRAITMAGPDYAKWWYWPIAKAAWREGRHPEALAAFGKSYDENNWLSHLQRAYVLSDLGDRQGAGMALARLREIRPGFTVNDALTAYRRWCFSEDYLARIEKALRFDETAADLDDPSVRPHRVTRHR